MSHPISAQSNFELVSDLKAKGVFHSNEVERVMSSIDRADFCSDEPYVDSPQPIGYGATISAPHMHATALEVLIDIIKPNSRILDVGCGSGYLTACFAKLLGSEGAAIGIEHIEELVELSKKNVSKHNGDLLESGKVQFVLGDGRNGHPDAAPYDVIHVGAAATELHKKLIEQLAVNGRMLIPVGQDEFDQRFMAVEKCEDGSIQQRTIAHVVYVPLTDAEKQWNKSFY
ncbi:Protein-L-isoaspartate(D-aspartate) O-methyltransferase [Aphelenchoides besseyi]|nr:Protein-L-isoaspartate(D-aspartate) O-methyltransferase [Aphelenchoides besseyi]